MAAAEFDVGRPPAEATMVCNVIERLLKARALPAFERRRGGFRLGCRVAFWLFYFLFRVLQGFLRGSSLTFFSPNLQFAFSTMIVFTTLLASVVFSFG